MPRALIHVPLTTPNARKALEQGNHYWDLSGGVHLGYRKGKRNGFWFVRWRTLDGRYRQAQLAAADDGGVSADGRSTMNFDQAKVSAANYVDEIRRVELEAGKEPIPTVGETVAAYVGKRNAKLAKLSHSRKDDALNRLTRHVLKRDIADKRLDQLTDDDLTEWRESIGESLAASSVQRIANDLRAALNSTPTRIVKRIPTLPVTIKHGLKSGEDSTPVARDGAALPDSEIRNIIKAARDVDEADEWEGDLYRLVLLLAATGARFSQLARVTVGDVQAERRRIMIPTSRKGRGTKRITHTPVSVGSDVINMLMAVTEGRSPKDPLLERWRHVQLPNDKDGRPRWKRDRRGAWKSSAELTRPWAQIIRKTDLPTDTVPYALRHSSIVRALRAGIPVRLVAQLHDTSDVMIERHYAAAIVDVMDDIAAKAVVPLID